MVSRYLHLSFFLNNISSFTKVPGGKAFTVLCNNWWFGLNGWWLFRLSEMAQRVLELRVASTSVRTVTSTSSSTRLSASIAIRAVRVLQMSLSHTELAWEALGGRSTHCHPPCSRSSLIRRLFQFRLLAWSRGWCLRKYIEIGWPSSVHRSSEDVNETVRLERSGQLEMYSSRIHAHEYCVGTRRLSIWEMLMKCLQSC